ncbi:hypothetical protein AMATHDRAFT_51671 [Amanita thiersii Skay4041]|uniref:Fruit-body specific protein a n=1 Tax=Amanita thiersii Skay4041 TaxID=703135 RepID=A0A2A9NAY7_9AGAR|nr:hypothetical protein AMATHDRAFT_51671 [Amanita thiersii Skay4041]
MPSFATLLCLTSLALTAAGATVSIVPPANQGTPDSGAATSNTSSTDPMTDTDTIITTASVVQQKSGAGADTPPDQPVSDTAITAVDGNITDARSLSRRFFPATLKRERSPDIAKRLLSGYTQLFSGTGTGPSDRDGAIEGTAYLTYTLVPNNTYNVDACLEFCNRVDRCVFANLYYEFNNELLDYVFSEHSNLKCVVYGDIHTAAEKTNLGGQQSIPPPAGLTYIQQSSGYGLNSLVEPTTPSGYELVFGPTNGANNAPGYMGFAFIDKYDVEACAKLCNSRDADPVGGACQYFNIWRALLNGVPTTYSCAMYYLPTDQSTAVNHGQGDLQVTYSRGYRRKSLLPDGGFEGYNGCSDFCFTESYENWFGTSQDGSLDATIFHYVLYAHTGHGVGLLGSAFGVDDFPGVLHPRNSLNTVAGKRYIITFFHQATFSGPALEANAFVQIYWNNVPVTIFQTGYEPWKFHSFVVTAAGGDVLMFRGGKAPSWSFIDDVYVFEMY